MLTNKNFLFDLLQELIQATAMHQGLTYVYIFDHFSKRAFAHHAFDSVNQQMDELLSQHSGEYFHETFVLF